MGVPGILSVLGTFPLLTLPAWWPGFASKLFPADRFSGRDAEPIFIMRDAQVTE